MTIKPSGYRPRLLDSSIARLLKGFGAVEVAGPKFCGKTWASMAHAESISHIDDRAVREIVEIQPELALEGKRPHVIDEWQDIPRIWDAARRTIDEEGSRGGFILTGSSSVDRTQVSHSGAGRIARVRMRTMSLQESGDSDGSASLAGLFEGTCPTRQVSTDIRDVAHLICRGGWPAAIASPGVASADLPAQYLDALFSISAAQAGLDPRLARRVAVALARNMGKTPTYRTLYANSFAEEPPKDADTGTLRKRLLPYLEFFEGQYFTEEQTGWDAPVKARSRVRSKAKRTFADPSLPASLLGMTPERLLLERQLLGNLFEELCLHDIRVYASALGAIPDPGVYYYADADGLEVDAVVELPDGRWGAFEIKLNEEKAPDGTDNLIRLRDKVLANPAAKGREPAFLAVLVGKANYCRTTPEGVFVVPVTCLGA